MSINLSVLTEYPSETQVTSYVIQAHYRGASLHVDWRIELNDSLIGFTLLGFKGASKTVTSVEEAKVESGKQGVIPFRNSVKNKSFRTEVKQKHSKQWISKEGVIPIGEVGATKQFTGVIVILDKGTVKHGVKKQGFLEFFVKSKVGNLFPKDTWSRIIIRKLTSKEGKDVWVTSVPKTEMPYAISNEAINSNWKPLSSYPTPYPVEWTKSMFKTQYAKWSNWINDKEKLCDNTKVSLFSLNKHVILSGNVKKLHYDLVFPEGYQISIPLNPLQLQVDNASYAYLQTYPVTINLMHVRTVETHVPIGNLDTYCTRLDLGVAYTTTTDFKNNILLQLKGEHLKGYFYCSKHEDYWVIRKVSSPDNLVI